MASVHYLKQFDKRQLFRFFVDGRFHKKYNGWVKYEEREQGSVQAMMNGFAFMMDNLHTQEAGLNAMYLLKLHRVCMLHVESDNPKTAPGDIRHLRNSMPFFKKTTTLEHIQEVLEMRMDDGTLVFNDKEIRKNANELDAKEVYQLLQKKEKLSYRTWYPNLDDKSLSALEGNETLSDFYDAKHYVQKVTASKMEEIVKRYNQNITHAISDDDKIKAIALIVRELELLHPFSDGNCRSFAGVLLNQLLIQNDLLPSMPYNPNLDGEYSLMQWVDEIKKGMELTQVLLEDKTASVYNYSINDMAKEHQERFLQKAEVFITKINTYHEIYLTPEKLARYTKGQWFNFEKTLRFTGVGNSAGNIAFITSTEELKKENKSIKQEILRLIKNQVRAIVIEDTTYLEDIKLPMYVVKDILKAYEEVSANIRQEVNPKTILITGTEGKTGTKIQIHHLFRTQVKTHAVLNSANAKLPVLRTLANLHQDDKCEIVEFSVDANEDKTIQGAQLVNPDVCFFTNIGKEHMHNHKSIDGVIKAKSAVVEGIRKGGLCIVNSSLEVYDDFVKALKQRRDDIKIITYGNKQTDNAYLLNAVFNTETLMWEIKANIDNEVIEYKIPLVQNHAPLMSVGILLLAKISGLNIQKAVQDYEKIKPYESMGLIHRIKKEDGEFLFYDQSRRASISGVRSAFKDLENFKIKGKLIVLMGSISSVNENEWTKAYQEELADLINHNKNIAKLYTTGSNMQYTHERLENRELLVLHSNNYEKLYEYISSDLQAGDLLFVMGYMRLYLNKFAQMILTQKYINSFDKNIYKLADNEALIKSYKQLYITGERERGQYNYVIRNNSGLTKEGYSSLRDRNISYRELRTKYLYQYFDDMTKILENDYGLISLNSTFKNSEYSNIVFTKEYCNDWFNNFDKKANEPKKQLFGTFFKIPNHENYFLFVLVGTINLHFGVGKLVNNEMAILDEKEHRRMQELFGKGLSDGLKLQPRTWGKKWLTIDAGDFIDMRKAEIFYSMIEIKKSRLFKEKLMPLIKSIVG